jgi:hypothetical protein
VLSLFVVKNVIEKKKNDTKEYFINIVADEKEVLLNNHFEIKIIQSIIGINSRS